MHLTVQLAAALLDAIQGATTSVVTGAAGVVSSPFRARNTARRHRAPKSPRTSNLRIQVSTFLGPHTCAPAHASVPCLYATYLMSSLYL